MTPKFRMPALVAVFAALSGCGGGTDAPPPPDGTAEATETPEAVATLPGDRAATGVTDARVLKLPRAGHPVVWLRPGAKLRLHAEPRGEVVATVGEETEWGSPTVFNVVRVKGAWAGVPSPHRGNDELAWIKLDPDLLVAGSVPFSLHVDLSDRTVELRRGERTLRSFPVSVGAPESPTPTGRFAVTDTFRGDLDPAYGCCAVALTARQPNLPSGWLGGDRIAIHGTTGPLGAEVSHGCVRARDADVNALVERIPPGTPVTITT